MRDLTGFSTGSFGVHSRLLLGTSVLVGASLLNGDSNGVMLEDGRALGAKLGTMEAIIRLLFVTLMEMHMDKWSTTRHKESCYCSALWLVDGCAPRGCLLRQWRAEGKIV